MKHFKAPNIYLILSIIFAVFIIGCVALLISLLNSDESYKLELSSAEILEVEQIDDTTFSVEHSVDYEYYDICNQSGDNFNTEFKDIDLLFEFVSLNSLEKDTTTPETPYYYPFVKYFVQNDPQELEENDYNAIDIKGKEFYRYTYGVEGCNRTYYFHKIDDEGVLFIEKDEIEVLDGHDGLQDDYENELIREFSSIPGVISNKDEREDLFLQVIDSIRIFKEDELILEF